MCYYTILYHITGARRVPGQPPGQPAARSSRSKCGGANLEMSRWNCWRSRKIESSNLDSTNPSLEIDRTSRGN